MFSEALRSKRPIYFPTLVFLKKKEEICTPYAADSNALHRAKEDFLVIVPKEEMMWKKRSRERWVAEVDQNTSYLYWLANGRHRRNLIIKLVVGRTNLSSEADIISGVSSFFKCYFSNPTKTYCNFDWEGLNFDSSWDNSSLVVPFLI